MFHISSIPAVLLTILLCVDLALCEVRSDVDAPTLGKIRGGGSSQSKKQSQGLIWRGVPYAKPPVGELRFKKPEMPERKELNEKREPFYVFDNKPGCPQYSDKPFPWYDFRPGDSRGARVSEDCLYMNIYAPSGCEEGSRPVKVYLIGGGWLQAGSARMSYYSGDPESRDTKNEDGSRNEDGIIIVDVQYRLGPLGFLTSGTDDAPGNMGALDIQMAIQFVFDNIAVFGGDPTKVTVVGQDGAAIVLSLLATNPDLFTQKFKVIVNGGTMLTLKALPGVDDQGDAYDNNLRLTDLLAESVGCETSVKDDPEGTIECLRGIEFERLVKTMNSLSQEKGPPNVFLPQVKGPHGLFADNPYKALAKNPDAAGQDTLSSFTSDEGSYLLTTAFPKVFGTFGANDEPLSASCAKLVARSFLRKFPPSVADQLLGDLDKNATVENRNKVVQAFGDAYYNCPTVFYIEQLKSNQGDSNRTFILEKQVFPPVNPWAEWMGSVHFSNVFIDFKPDSNSIRVWPPSAQDKDYSSTVRSTKNVKYSEETLQQAKVYYDLLINFLNEQDLPIDEFTLDNPAYGVLAKDGTISSDGTTNYHGKNCDILRPFFQFKG